MSICLLPEKIEEFKRKLKTREIKIADLMRMTSEERVKILEEYAGKNAEDVNRLLEEKRILKNRELGMRNAIDRLTERGRYSPKVKARLDAIKSEWKAKQQERIFSPKENETFLKSLADKITGAEITREEATALFGFEKTVNDSLEAGYNRKTEKWLSKETRATYEVSKLMYEKYYQMLLNPEIELNDAIKEYIQEYKDIYKEFEGVGKIGQVVGTAVKGGSKASADLIITLFNASRKILATADNSFHGTQGAQQISDNPKEWFKQLIESFVRIGKELYGIDTFDAIMMRMYSEPNYINGRMQKAGVIDTIDEIFPHIVNKNIKLGKTGEKILSTPVVSQVVTGLKRIDKAAESAFKGSSLMLRINAFNQAIGLAKEGGINVDDTKELKEIGDIINTSVGRGKIDAKNPFDAVAKVLLWSARLLKSKIEIVSNLVTAKTPFAKKMAFKSLIRFAIFQATVITLSEIFNKDDTKTNPLDSRFGKIPLGHKRYLDTSGGRLALISLIAKLLPSFMGGGGKISAQTDKFVPFNNRPSGSTRMKELLNFTRNRLAPGLGAIVDIATGMNSNFEEATPKNVLLKNFVPISGQTAKDIVVEGPTAERFIDLALNFIGFNVSNYQDSKTKKKK